LKKYYIIAPFDSEDKKKYEEVWNYDFKHNTIAIGWNELKDISQKNKKDIKKKIREVYSPEDEWYKGKITRVKNALYDFYHNINVGDIILARKGTKKLVGVGEVIGKPYYSVEEAKKRDGTGACPNFIKVKWQKKEIQYSEIVFSIFTIYSIDENKFHALTEYSMDEKEIIESDEKIITSQEQEFALEKYLEQFIVDNFSLIFDDSLKIWTSDEGESGHQFTLLNDNLENMGRIDILAKNEEENYFLVIELKKGKSSDRVVGQISRYMGFIKEYICEGDEKVKGLIICKEMDEKLDLALKSNGNIDLNFYEVDFTLKENIK